MGGLARSQRALNIAAATSLAGAAQAINGLAVLSAVACVLATVFWVRSYRFDESLNRFPSSSDDVCYSLRSYLGRVHFIRSRQLLMFREGVQSDAIDWDAPFVAWYDEYGLDESWERWGFGYARGTFPAFGIGRPPDSPDATSTALVIPHWSIVLSTAALPLKRAVHALRRRRRYRAGLCLACGYDLRASPERCPECGPGSGAAPA